MPRYLVECHAFAASYFFDLGIQWLNLWIRGVHYAASIKRRRMHPLSVHHCGTERMRRHFGPQLLFSMAIW